MFQRQYCCSLHPVLNMEEKNRNAKAWLKRIGIAGFLFFLIKGLIWLAVFFFAGSKIFESCN